RLDEVLDSQCRTIRLNDAHLAVRRPAETPRFASVEKRALPGLDPTRLAVAAFHCRVACQQQDDVLMLGTAEQPMFAREDGLLGIAVGEAKAVHLADEGVHGGSHCRSVPALKEDHNREHDTALAARMSRSGVVCGGL